MAPPLNFGSSPYFLEFPGTFSLRVSTLLDVVEDLVRSAFGQGFRRFLILNGHGGNDPVRGRMYELVNDLAGLRITWYSWWLAQSVQKVASDHGLKPYHANWLEAFPFTRVADLPEGEKQAPVVSGMLNASDARQVYGDGSFGGLYHASDEIMEELFRAALADILQLIKFEN